LNKESGEIQIINVNSDADSKKNFQLFSSKRQKNSRVEQFFKNFEAQKKHGLYFSIYSTGSDPSCIGVLIFFLPREKGHFVENFTYSEILIPRAFFDNYCDLFGVFALKKKKFKLFLSC